MIAEIADTQPCKRQAHEYKFNRGPQSICWQHSTMRTVLAIMVGTQVTMLK